MLSAAKHLALCLWCVDRCSSSLLVISSCHDKQQTTYNSRARSFASLRMTTRGGKIRLTHIILLRAHREILQRFGIEQQSIAPGTQQVLLAKLGQGEAHGLAGSADGLGELAVRDAQHDAASFLRRRCCGIAETKERLHQPRIAIIKYEAACFLAGSLQLPGKLTDHLQRHAG